MENMFNKKEIYFVLISVLFVLLSCRTKLREIAVVNHDNPCENFILFNHVKNRIKITQEAELCDKSAAKWVVESGSFEYIGHCEYIITPQCSKSETTFIITNGRDTLEFFVLPPTVNEICISNFGCSNQSSSDLTIEIRSDYPDLVFDEIEYDYEVIKNKKLYLQGHCNSFILPRKIQEIKSEFEKEDYIVLRNIFIKSKKEVAIELDSVINYYAKYAWH